MAKVDRSRFPPGEWDSEPDELFWVDAETGLECWIHRSFLGSLCGYVGVRQGSRLHGIKYSAGDVEGVRVHGGLTFSGSLTEATAGMWFFGFDCAHFSDYAPGMHVPGLSHDYRDIGVYRDIAYVQREVASLALQIQELNGRPVRTRKPAPEPKPKLKVIGSFKRVVELE